MRFVLILYRYDIFRIDMIDKIVLGLLSKKALTVYDIKVAMEKSINRFYSNSLGSINPAIKKLEREHLITRTEVVENNRLKKVYDITDKGKEAFRNWMAEPITQGRLKDEVLIRVFFLGDTDAVERKKLITDYIQELNKSKEELEVLQEQIRSSDLSAEQLQEVRFQMATLQFGIDYMAFKQTWFQGLLTEI